MNERLLYLIAACYWNETTQRINIYSVERPERMLTCGLPEHLQPKDTFLESEALLDVLDLELAAQGD